MNKHLEIERKFLVDSIEECRFRKSTYIKQAYLLQDATKSLRVRIKGKKALMTLKATKTEMARYEYEYEVPLEDAEHMIKHLDILGSIEKTRHVFDFKGLVFEVDEFHGVHQGLILAEVELSAESQRVELPPFIGKEVTNDPRYLNINLATSFLKK